jgi:hypothetical protein
VGGIENIFVHANDSLPLKAMREHYARAARAARKVGQYAGQKVDHLRSVSFYVVLT